MKANQDQGPYGKAMDEIETVDNMDSQTLTPNLLGNYNNMKICNSTGNGEDHGHLRLIIGGAWISTKTESRRSH